MTKGKRFAAATLIGVLAFAFTWIEVDLATAITAEQRREFCRYQTADGKLGWSNEDVGKLITCAARHYGVSVRYMKFVAARESGFNEDATNPFSGACGVYQHLPRYWPGRVAEFSRAAPRWKVRPDAPCHGPRPNVLVSARMMSKGSDAWG